MEGEEHILESRYGSVSIPLKANSLASFLVEEAANNAQRGRTKWMTNSMSGETLTFGEIGPLSARVASAMWKRGMRKGDVVLYLTTDVTRIFVAMVGIWRAGGALYSSYVEDTQEHLAQRIQESKARWVLCDGSAVPQCLAAKARISAAWDVEILVFGDTPVEHCSLVNSLFEDAGDKCPTNVETTLDDPALILCTSGTTGNSKGAVYTNRSVLAFCVGTDAIPWSSKPALYLIKCTHVLGVLFPIRNVYGGNWALMMPQIIKENVYKAVHTYKPFLVFGFPTFLLSLVTDSEAQSYDRSSVEIMCTGGVVITATIYETLAKLPSLKAVINGYGMTECGAVTTTIDLACKEEIRAIPSLPPLTVGLLYPNTQLKIIDLNTGVALPPNEKGEIAFRSPVACSTYLGRPQETRDTFQGGWIRSGDMGYYDEQGFLFIVDRLKETFKYFNNHISPAELEELLLQHPSVAEACVVGITDPDGGDRIPRAFVVLKDGVRSSAVDPEEIRAFVDGKVAGYMRLRGGVHIVDSLPRGKTGKVLRSALLTP